MLIDIIVPAVGESIASANVARWHRQAGDTVRRGDTLVTLETDKVSNELEASHDGILQILVPEGREVPIGTLIAQIQTERWLQPASETTASPAVPVSPAVPASPQIDPVPADQPRTTRRKLSLLRRKIATQLVNAQQTAAILTTFNEVDMSAVMELRSQVQEAFTQKYGFKLGLMSFFIKATVAALKYVPTLNARIDGTDVIENHFFDISVAIATATGLIVPVLRECDQKSFAELERELADLAEKARAGKLTLADLQGGVFTISNGGVYGSLLSTPILNAPQSGLLGMHTIQQRPVARDGQVVIRPMMYLALSYDHRLVDGREAVQFLVKIKEYIEDPAWMLLDA